MFDFFRNTSSSTQRKKITVPFDYSIVSSKRKTLSIQVKAQKVIVKAPVYLEEAEILNFVYEKQQWITDKLNIQQQKENQAESIRQNHQILVGGELKSMRFYQASSHSICDTSDTLDITIPNRVKSHNQEAYIQQKILKWFEANANQLFPQRLNALSEQCQLFPRNLQIKKYKARWGSCSNKGLISLNYLLMMTPKFVIDYVIIHELCHLRHMNHSAAFWTLVEYHCPNYREAKQWLKDNHTILQANNL